MIALDEQDKILEAKYPDIPYYYHKGEPGVLLFNSTAVKFGISEETYGDGTEFHTFKELEEKGIGAEKLKGMCELAYTDSYSNYGGACDIDEAKITNCENHQHVIYTWEEVGLIAQNEYERDMLRYTDRYYDYTSFVTELYEDNKERYDRLTTAYEDMSQAEEEEQQADLDELVKDLYEEFTEHETELWANVEKVCGKEIYIERATFEDFMKSFDYDWV